MRVFVNIGNEGAQVLDYIEQAYPIGDDLILGTNDDHWDLRVFGANKEDVLIKFLTDGFADLREFECFYNEAGETEDDDWDIRSEDWDVVPATLGE